MMDSDLEDVNSDKKLFMDSDFELNNKAKNRKNPPKKQNRQDDLFYIGKIDSNTIDPEDSVASMETIDAFVGPVKADFDQLKRLIE
jgi:hypothetical protein